MAFVEDKSLQRRRALEQQGIQQAIQGLAQIERAQESQRARALQEAQLEQQNRLAQERLDLQRQQLEQSRQQSIRQAEREREARQLEIEDEKRKEIRSLRKEINSLPETKELKQINTSLQKVRSAARRGTPGSDIALVFNFMKILDPNSVVREGEFATAQNAGGVPERVRTTFNRLLEGDRLAPERRRDFLNTAVEQAKANVETFKSFTETQRRAARERGLPEELIFPQLDESVFAPESSLARGEREGPAQAREDRVSRLRDPSVQQQQFVTDLPGVPPISQSALSGQPAQAQPVQQRPLQGAPIDQLNLRRQELLRKAQGAQ